MHLPNGAEHRRNLARPDKGVIGGFMPSELPIMLADDEAIGDDHGVDAYRHRAPGTDALHAVAVAFKVHQRDGGDAADPLVEAVEGRQHRLQRSALFLPKLIDRAIRVIGMAALCQFRTASGEPGIERGQIGKAQLRGSHSAIDRTASPLPCVRYGNDSGFCGLKLERGERLNYSVRTQAGRGPTAEESGFMKASW